MDSNIEIKKTDYWSNIFDLTKENLMSLYAKNKSQAHPANPSSLCYSVSEKRLCI